jgi:hypothetical protein
MKFQRGEPCRNYSKAGQFFQFTVKLVELVAMPPEVVMVILPVTAPVGTVAAICVS